jgi:hypothetical protein
VSLFARLLSFLWNNSCGRTARVFYSQTASSWHRLAPPAAALVPIIMINTKKNNKKTINLIQRFYTNLRHLDVWHVFFPHSAPLALVALGAQELNHILGNS